MPDNVFEALFARIFAEVDEDDVFGAEDDKDEHEGLVTAINTYVDAAGISENPAEMKAIMRNMCLLGFGAGRLYEEEQERVYTAEDHNTVVSLHLTAQRAASLFEQLIDMNDQMQERLADLRENLG